MHTSEPKKMISALLCNVVLLKRVSTWKKFTVNVPTHLSDPGNICLLNRTVPLVYKLLGSTTLYQV